MDVLALHLGAPSILILIGGITAAIGAYWWGVRIREATPRRQKFLAGGVILLGTIFGVLGTVGSFIREDKFETNIIGLNSKLSQTMAELSRKQSENQRLTEQVAEQNDRISRQNQTIAKAMTGGEGYCYVIFRFGDDKRTPLAETSNPGEFPLYDVTALVKDPDARVMNEQEALQEGRVLNLGDIPPRAKIPIGIWTLPRSGHQRYDISFSARNGTWKQLIRLRGGPARWFFATIVKRDIKGQKETLYRYKDNGYPPEADGTIF
jgi:hypothetical protein